MASVNRVILIGNLTRDPEVRYTQSGKAVANVSIATNESYKNKDTGERVEKPEYHRVTFFDKLAEIVGQYLKKGSKIYLEGKLQTRKWQDKDGQDRYTTEILGSEMRMLGGNGNSNGNDQSRAAPAPSASEPALNSGNDFDDDIQF